MTYQFRSVLLNGQARKQRRFDEQLIRIAAPQITSSATKIIIIRLTTSNLAHMIFFAQQNARRCAWRAARCSDELQRRPSICDTSMPYGTCRSTCVELSHLPDERSVVAVVVHTTGFVHQLRRWTEALFDESKLKRVNFHEQIQQRTQNANERDRERFMYPPMPTKPRRSTSAAANGATLSTPVQ